MCEKYDKKKGEMIPFYIIYAQNPDKEIRLVEVIYDRFTGKVFLGSCKMPEFYKGGKKSVYITVEYKPADRFL